MNLFVNARFLTQPVSGVQRYSIEVSRQIKELWPDTVFLTPHNIRHESLAAILGATVIGKRTGHLWEQTELPRFLKNKGNVPLLCPGNTGPLSYQNSFITLHDLAFLNTSYGHSFPFLLWYRFLIPRIINNARHVFTVSKTMAEAIAAKYHVPGEKISVTYNGIAEGFTALKDISIAKEPIILSVGSFSKRKNHDKLLAAFLSSESLNRSHQLFLTGNQAAIFRETGISIINEPSIKIINGLDDKQLADLYNRASLVVSLSSYEGFGLPVLEGLYFNCHVLCADIEVYRELFGDNVYFCDHSDVDSVRAALEQIKTGTMDHPAKIFERYNYRAAAKIITETIARALTP